MKTIKKFICFCVSVLIMFNTIITPGSAATEEAPIITSVLSSTAYTAEEAGAIVPFDYNGTYNELYTHVQENNPSLSPDQIQKIAQALTDNIAEVESNLQADTYTTRSSQGDSQIVIPLGRIVDGELSQIATRTPILDSYSGIVSEGWSITPHVANSTTWVRFQKFWEGFDNYKADTVGHYKQEVERKIEVKVGFQTGMDSSTSLSSTDCKKFNLSVTASATCSSIIRKGFSFDVQPWHKVCIRPYIYYNIDDYSGRYRYYCYNSLNKSYFYVYEDRTATNTYLVESSYRTWSRENVNHDPYATVPIPPVEWEW